MVTITLEVDGKTQVALVEGIELKLKALDQLLTSCIKQKQDDAAKLVLADIKTLQNLKAEVEAAE